jgi:hypothetical protein
MMLKPLKNWSKFKKTILISSCLLFTSCSFVGIGYKYADWLIKRRIMEVVKFYSPQQERLEKILDDYMVWHQKVMLPKYLAEVSKSVKRIETSIKDSKKPITSQEIHDFILRARQLYLDSFIPLAHRVSPVLSELGEEQVERSRTLINRKMEEVKEKAELSKEDYRKVMYKKWEDNLEDWFGDVSAKQMAMVDKSLDSMITSPKARFARGGRRMQEFFSIYENHPLDLQLKDKDKAKVKEILKTRELLLKAFFDNWSKKRPYDEWRKNISSFMESFLKSLNPEQQKYFLDKVKGWETSLKELIEV